MNPIYIGIVFLVIFAIYMIAIGLGFRFIENQRKKQVEGMLKVAAGAENDGPTIILTENAPDNPLATLIEGTDLQHRISRMIQQAGLPWTPSRLVAMTLIAIAVGAAIGGIFRPLAYFSLSVIFVGALTGSIPFFYLRSKRNKRMAAFEDQLPEALDFLARSMRAGHAFSVSLEMLGVESPEPIGQEFRVLFNEQNLGAPLEVALQNFAKRVPLIDVRLLVSSVLLQRQTGGNLSEIMMRLAYVIRERFRLRGQVKAASAHGRLTAVVLSILPIVLVFAMLFVAPGYLQGMANDPDGKWLIIGAIFAQFLGYIIMRRITEIKV